MMIAARAIGSNEMLVYVRAEYPLAVERMRAPWLPRSAKASWERTSSELACHEV